MVLTCSGNSHQHIITGAMNASPEDSFGGILADDMGLGKSLSMISAIVASKDHALKFACFHELGAQPVAKQVVASKATLIVVPSACKLSLTDDMFRLANYTSAHRWLDR